MNMETDNRRILLLIQGIPLKRFQKKKKKSEKIYYSIVYTFYQFNIDGLSSIINWWFYCMRAFCD